MPSSGLGTQVLWHRCRMKINQSITLCKIFAITNLGLYLINASVANLVIGCLMVGYVLVMGLYISE